MATLKFRRAKRRRFSERGLRETAIHHVSQLNGQLPGMASTASHGVYLLDENLNVARGEVLLKKFKFTTTISTREMHIFDADSPQKRAQSKKIEEEEGEEILDLKSRLARYDINSPPEDSVRGEIRQGSAARGQRNLRRRGPNARTGC